MDSPAKPTYRFENVELNVARGSILCQGEERHLRPKTFQVLLHLIENRERLVSKGELIETVWKDTAVTDDVLVQCVKEIRRALGDDSHKPQFVKTVPKIGYRFITPIEISTNSSHSYQTEEITRFEFEYEEESDNQANALITSEIAQPRRRFSNIRLAAAAAAAVLVIGSVAYFVPKLLFAEARSADASLPQIAGKRSVAVMNFKNQTEDAELEWLREGLAEMLVTNLSRSKRLTILSRGQLHQLLETNDLGKGDDLSTDAVLKISNQAKAESAITGSFAKLGEKIRVDAQIVDSRDGSLIATESLTVENSAQLLTDIDLLSLKLARHLGGEIDDSRANFADAMTDDLEAFRYYSLGIDKVLALHNKEAIELFERAAQLDPQFAMAHARIGYTYSVMWAQTEKGKPYLEKAFKLSDRLTEKDRLNIKAWYAIANQDFDSAIGTYKTIIAEYPLETESYWRLGRLLSGEERKDEAIETLKQGLSIDPNSKNINNSLGGIYSEMGRHADAILAHRRYVELAPTEPNAHDSLGLSYQWSGDYESAIASYNRALELDPQFEIALVHLGNARFQTGQYGEAIRMFERYIQIAPSDSERVRGWATIAEIHLKKHNVDAAQKASDEALKIDRQAVWPPLLIALARGDLVRAKRLENAYFQSYRSDRGTRFAQRFNYCVRGHVAMKSGQSDAAISNFQEAIKRRAPIWNVDSHEDCLANAYLELGRYDEAIAEFQRILQLNPNYPLANYSLARTYQAKGQLDLAAAAYQRFLTTWSHADADIPEIEIARKYVASVSGE